MAEGLTQEFNMLGSGNEMTLCIPRNCIREPSGFSIDYGVSMLKVAYAEPDGDTVMVHFRSFPSEMKDEAFAYIKTNLADMIKPGAEVYLTGIGCSKEKEFIEASLGIRQQTVYEFQCFIDGFIFLTSHFPLRNLIFSTTDKVRQYESLFHKFNYYRLMSNPMDDTHHQVEPYDHDLVPDAVEYPALIFMLGSNGFPLYVESDGHYECLDGYNMCGRSLLACASLLAGTKDYDEMMELADRGCPGNVNVMVNAVLAESKDESQPQDNYTDVLGNSDMVAFPLGHGLNKQMGDFRQEDRAAAVVTLYAQNLGMWSQMWAAQMKAKHVYFCGSLPTNSQLIRDELHKVFAYKATGQRDGVRSHAHFLKLGGYLGALGCLLKNLGIPQ